MRAHEVRPTAARTAITHTRVLDGTGNPEYLGDIVLESGLIAGILPAGSFKDDGATVLIDGAGLVACPGFINLRGTSDTAPLTDPARHSALTQGVTTEVLGQDGAHCAPLTDASASVLRNHLSGLDPDWADRDVEWRTVGQYLDHLDSGTGTNTAYLVPKNAVRALATGSPAVAPGAQQLVAEVKAMADALEQGAVGLSSSAPGDSATPAETAELEALCAAVGAYGGYWAPDLDSLAVPAAESATRSVELAAKTGVPVHLTHLAADSAGAADLLAVLDRALKAGVDLSCDSHPYLENPGMLASLLPGWARDGQDEDVLARLDDPEAVARISSDLEASGIDWDALTIAFVCSGQLAMLVGQSIARIAAIQSSDPVTTLARILHTDSLATGVLYSAGTEEDLRAILVHRTHTGAGVGFGSDTAGHPGVWGSFPRFVGALAREAKAMDLPAVIHQLTGRPAQRLRLSNRGVLAAGNAADVLVFDPDAIIDMATFADPRQPAAGINHVFVNGVPAVSEHQPTSALAGRALRRGTEGTTQSL